MRQIPLSFASWYRRTSRKTLSQSTQAKALFDAITSKARAKWIPWIGDTKQTETRVRRIEKTVERLSEGVKRPSD